LPQVKGSCGLKLEKDDIVNFARGAEANVNIGESNPKQTDPSPKHVAGIQATDTVISLGAGGSPGLGVQKSPDKMAQ
jgi:hypothetical protein